MVIHFYTHEDCLDHNPGVGHPENPQRLSRILNALAKSPVNQSLQLVEAPLGEDKQVLLAHHETHYENVKGTAPSSGEAALDADTHMSPGSLNAALRAVGAACEGIDLLMRGKADNVFCATRPPGHHATPQQAMGFCLFNQIAIAAIHAQQHYSLERVLIMDFDVHHGNGTQDIVKGRKGIFFISSHQSPLYPGTGHEAENIEHNIMNVPLLGGTGHDMYQEIFQERIITAIENYAPQLLLVSAGFDAHAQDPLAGLAFTDETYAWLGTTLKELSNKYSGGKMLSVLEGGYNLDVLPGSVFAYLEGILGA
ncbi:MAG: histone deacetylase family protein [Gammaproteobacteria bacterium]|jgi:acetoin utilization deacetylase AcuC-like enzyme|nr:histone deacetylase family protein [Gammaproteobacteria bacterium]